MGKLLLNGASPGEVNFICVLQGVTDLLEILVGQGDFEVIRRILTRVRSRPWILGMSENDKFRSVWVVTYDGRVVRIHPNSEPLFNFV